MKECQFCPKESFALSMETERKTRSCLGKRSLRRVIFVEKISDYGYTLPEILHPMEFHFHLNYWLSDSPRSFLRLKRRIQILPLQEITELRIPNSKKLSNWKNSSPYSSSAKPGKEQLLCWKETSFIWLGQSRSFWNNQQLRLVKRELFWPLGYISVLSRSLSSTSEDGLARADKIRRLKHGLSKNIQGEEDVGVVW